MGYRQHVTAGGGPELDLATIVPNLGGEAALHFQRLPEPERWGYMCRAMKAAARKLCEDSERPVDPIQAEKMVLEMGIDKLERAAMDLAWKDRDGCGS